MMLQPSEQSLKDIIVKRNPVLALKYLDLFYEHATVQLSGVDTNGKSFLHYALEAGLKEVAHRLLEKEINDAFLFGRDNAGQTCLFLAARQGYSDIVEVLIAKNKAAKPEEDGYKIWLQPDSQGNVPLHAAVEKREMTTVQLLIEEISREEEEDAVNHINRINDALDTPLHLATSRQHCSVDINLVALLIQQGADLTLTNIKKQTPFLSVCQLDFSEQITLFNLLKQNMEKQLFFLQLYRNNVIAHRDDTNLLQQYYQLACSHSLTMYVRAKLEFDNSMDIRNFYPSIKKNHSTGNIERVDIKIPHSIFKTIPLYKNKVDFAMQILLPEELCDTDEASFSLESKIKQERYHLLHQNQTMLLELMKETNAFILDVESRSEIATLSGIKLTLLVSTVLLFLYLVIEIPLIVNTMRLNKNPETTFVEHTLNGLPPLIFGVTAFMLIAFVIGIVSILPHRPAYISQNEWKDLIEKQRSLLVSLQNLEQKNLQDEQGNIEHKTHALPVPVTTIRSFETTIVEFECDSKTVVETKDSLGRLDGVLKDIRAGMVLTNNPFSMFHVSSDCVIDMRKETSSEPLEEINAPYEVTYWFNQ